MKSYDKSQQMLARAKAIIPTCSQTFSKNYWYYPQPVAPVYLEHGEGAFVWDVDGNYYTDFVLGLGAVTLGYRNSKVNAAINNQLESGISFSLPHGLELEFSELVTRIVPCAEMVRILKTGSDVCAAAVRVARAYTGRELILCQGYHGWHEQFMIDSDRPKGIPKDYAKHIKQFEYNDIDKLSTLFQDNPEQVAAVIMEPMIIHEPKHNYLEVVKALCEANGAVLIFDEVVCGARWALGGAQEYFGVTPDLATFGKGIANGMPLAFVCGRKEIMREFEEVMVSSTNGGETLSIAAGKATLEYMRNLGTIEWCWRMGNRLREGLADIGYEVAGYACRPAIITNYSLEEKSILIQELLKRNVLLHSGLLINLCYAHTTDQIDSALSRFEDVYKGMKTGKFTLEGRIERPAFKRY